MILAALLLFAVPAPLPRLQEPSEKSQLADERAEIKALLDELGGHLKAKGEQDPQAIEVVDKLTQEFPNCGPKDRAAVVKSLSDCFDVKRPKELEPDVPDDRLYKAAATAFSLMGPESVKPLIAQIGSKEHRKNSSLQQMLALSLGKTKSVEGIKPLLMLLKHKDAPMQAAGAQALANFFDASLDTRKTVFEELLKTMMDQKSRKDNVTDLEAQERWNVISGPIIETLQKVSGHGETDPELWQRWWNENKKKEWGSKEG
ncbi:MAG: HEAT repeat domain-containing protein [Planctomycetes bacterium]|nr:HEAT repeat domain-containing protein [Planctomycetota bacterium]